MARKVSQISPQTIVKKVEKKQQSTVWISGLKLDKYAGDENQHIKTYFVEPQEVKVDFGDVSKWGSAFSCDRIVLLDVKMSDGSTIERMQRYTVTQYGIKFFKDKEHAKKYFLVVTKNLWDTTSQANKQYKIISDEIKVHAPNFIDELTVR